MLDLLVGFVLVVYFRFTRMVVNPFRNSVVVPIQQSPEMYLTKATSIPYACAAKTSATTEP